MVYLAKVFNDFSAKVNANLKANLNFYASLILIIF